MHVHILGSAAGGGFPQWNCNCINCSGLRNGQIQATARTQSSIAISDDGIGWVLMNASPDIRAQLEAFPALQPARAIRDTAIIGIVLMDSQVDHTTGLLMLREGQRLDIYCTEMVRQDLTTGNPLFTILGHYCGVNWHPIRLEEAAYFTVPGAANLRFFALPLESKAPPYSAHRHAPHIGDNIGVLVQDRRTEKSLFYAPGLGAVDTRLRTFMAQADCLLIDGTFWRDDELIAAGIASKRAQDMGHLPQSGHRGMLSILADMPRPRKILIHINNTNPILNAVSPERAMLCEAGIEVAYDGMDVRL